MSGSKDTWPLPKYSVGPEKHLHAIGVISNCFNAFERGMFDLYRHYFEKHAPQELSEFLYLALNERTRAKAIDMVVHAYEADQKVLTFFDSLATYFDWCWNARNQILHAELYPPMFGGADDEIQLTKRKRKQSVEPGYLRFDLPMLRDIADKIEDGKRRCASLRIYLRQRDTPSAQWSTSMKLIGPEALPDVLATPKPVQLSSHPVPTPPPRLRDASRK
jgi:hypothetical protein